MEMELIETTINTADIVGPVAERRYPASAVVRPHLPCDLGPYAPPDPGTGSWTRDYLVDGGGILPQHDGYRAARWKEEADADAEGIETMLASIAEAAAARFVGAFGIRPSTASVCLDRAEVRAGTSHRFATDNEDGWHLDGGGPLRIIWCSSHGTEYATDETEVVRDDDVFGGDVTAEPEAWASLPCGRMFVVPTEHFVHRSPVLPADADRTFLRVSFGFPRPDMRA